jgi:hypothetical protein
MRLSQEAIREFKEIYEAEFGERLSDVQAEHAGLRLLRFFWILSQQTGHQSTPADFSTSPGGTHTDGQVR